MAHLRERDDTIDRGAVVARAREILAELRRVCAPGERVDMFAREPAPAGVLLRELLELPMIGLAIGRDPRLMYDAPTIGDVEEALAASVM